MVRGDGEEILFFLFFSRKGGGLCGSFCFYFSPFGSY